jgi:hypothetical protein
MQGKARSFRAKFDEGGIHLVARWNAALKRQKMGAETIKQQQRE